MKTKVTKERHIWGCFSNFLYIQSLKWLLIQNNTTTNNNSYHQRIISLILTGPCKWKLRNSFRTWCTINGDDNRENQLWKVRIQSLTPRTTTAEWTNKPLLSEGTLTPHIMEWSLRDSTENGNRNVPQPSLGLSEPSITTK